MGGGAKRTGLAAVPLLACVAVLAAVAPATAAKQKVTTGIVNDQDAKLNMVLQKTKKGQPTKVTGLGATKYDLRCQTLNQPETAKNFEVDFSFPAIDVKTERKGKYRYSFSGKADSEDPFTDGFYLHAGVAKGWFTVDKKGKLQKLVGYLSMGGLSNSIPGVPAPGQCSDATRDNDTQKLHGSFSASLR